ncbi:hypothetical protein [Pedococcus soli]
MGMDVYVGPLSRYLSGDWLTLVQQVGAAAGHHVEVVRPEGSRLSPEDAATAAATWRDELCAALPCGPAWREGTELPYWTDKPDWDGYGGLVLLASYVEQPDLAPGRGGGFLRRGRTDDPRDFTSAPAFVEAAKAPKRFPSLLKGAQWWLPVDTGPVLFRSSTPSGPMLMMARISALLVELKGLSEAVGLTDRAEQAAVRQAGPPRPGADAQTCGRFGLSTFLPLAGKAYVDKQPLVLDH